MKNQNAFSIKHQSSPEELAKAIANVCHYDFTVQERDMARQMRNYDKANFITVTQDVNQLIKPE